MPVELSIVETVTELETTVVEIVLESASAPGPAGPGVPAGGTANQVLTKDSGTDYDTSWQDAQGGGGGAPDDATYLVTAAHADLSAEVVVGATPGGELGGTWASPTVDATHSGSSHASVQAAAEATAAAALSAHEADTTSVHGIADTSALALTANHPSNATFNDHSARHENGGADEISLAGLDGTPTDLQTHLDDATAAHAGSAISVDSTNLSGTGTTVQASLEELDNLLDDHSARHEDGGADEISIAGLSGTSVALQSHLDDTSDAHDASAISVLDTNGDYTATDVEGVLAEIAPQLGGGGGGLLGLKVYAPSTQTIYTLNFTTLTDADATNAAVTFTAPASGNVLVRVSCWVDLTTNEGFLGLRESSSDISGTVTRIQRVNTDNDMQQYLSVPMYVTGLSGGSHTLKVAGSVASGGTLRLIIQDGTVATTKWGPLIIEVWEAP